MVDMVGQNPKTNYTTLGPNDHSKRPQTEKLPKNEKIKYQKLIIFEGFRPNGLQIRNQRIFLHRIAPVKIDFDDFLKRNMKFRNLKP